MPRPVTAWSAKNFTAFAVLLSGEVMQLRSTLTFSQSRRALDALGVAGWVHYAGEFPADSLDIIAERTAEGIWTAASPLTAEVFELAPKTAA